MLAFCFAVFMLSPQPAGELRVQIADPSGAPMEIAGTLTSLTAKVARNFHADAQGRATIHNLPFGRYRLEITKAGFAPHSEEIEIIGASVSREIRMTLAAVASQVEVSASTPLPGVSLPIDAIPAPVQVATDADIAQSGAVTLADLMNRRLNGVSINEMQGNPFQPDVNFRGYTASPLLGTPEGISVYADGVRQNQPFGDVVSWDLIPKNAISEVTLVPGSDPLFGLNTLGAALSVETKSGVTNPGFSATATYGSSNRKALEAEYGGGHPTGFNWFVAGNIFHESGWRIDSPSDVRQAFARAGWRDTATDVSLTAAYAENALTGNGLQDYRLLERNYSSVYSIPDSIANRAPSLNLILRHTFGNAISASANAWYRHIHTDGTNANLNTNSFDQSVYQPNAREIATLTAAGYTGVPTSGATAANTPFPKWRCIAEALVNGDVDDLCNGVDIFSGEAQSDFGFSGQVVWSASISGVRNQLVAGAAVDRAKIAYIQNTQYGYLNPDYTVGLVPAFQDGTAATNPVDSRVSLSSHTPSESVFFTDTVTVAKKWNLTLSGRFNRLAVNNLDNINPAGPGSLFGNNVFERFNPGVGLTYSPNTQVNLYANYRQANRAPTAIELGCADPANPCSLPNALASDPPLQQVTAETWEGGVRGTSELRFLSNVRWNAGAFSAENHNDILFVSSVELGTGYFKNFAKTRREGLDANIDGRFGRVTWGADWTFLSATYQSTETVDGAANNTSDSAIAGTPGLDGSIYIHPGNRIPLIPKQSGKVYADFRATKRLGLDAGVIAASSAYARGNENNAYKADGVYYLGPGVSPGYAVANLRAHYDLAKRWQLAVQIDNLFNRHYDSAAQLAHTGFSAQGTFLARPFPAYASGPQAGNYPLQSVTFFAPGAPRRAWMELRFLF